MNNYLKEINRNEVLKYIGYSGGVIDEKLETDIQLCSQEIIKNSKPKVCFKVFDFDENYLFGGTNFIPGGNDIKDMLKECKRAIIMAATIGGEVENIIRKYEVKDMYMALILDSCASSAVENVCNNFQSELEEKLSPKGLFLTDRFSPGYGDMPFAQQKELCSILDTAKNIGVNLSSSGIMIPRKSVTAVMGISDKKQTRRFMGCEYCSMFENCNYRKGGITCGKN